MGRRWRTALLVAGLLVLVAASNLWLATTQAGALLLLKALEWQSSPADPREVRAGAQAIVVLGGRTSRIHDAARLHLATGVPLALVGKGTGDSGFEAESEKMEDILLRQYGIGPRWVEVESFNTRENAVYAWCLLASMGVRSIALVTHGYHMPRAKGGFEAAGFHVIPVPLPGGYPPLPALAADSFLPSRAGIAAARLPLREWAGVLFGPADRVLNPPRRCDVPAPAMP